MSNITAPNENGVLDRSDRTNLAILRDKMLDALPADVRTANEGKSVLINVRTGKYKFPSQQGDLFTDFANPGDFMCYLTIRNVKPA